MFPMTEVCIHPSSALHHRAQTLFQLCFSFVLTLSLTHTQTHTHMHTHAHTCSSFFFVLLSLSFFSVCLSFNPPLLIISSLSWSINTEQSQSFLRTWCILWWTSPTEGRTCWRS